MAGFCLPCKRGTEWRILPDGQINEALLEELERLLALNFINLWKLMASAAPEIRDSYQSKLDALKAQYDEARNYVDTLPQRSPAKNGRFRRLERMIEEIGTLIKEMREKLK